MSGRKTARVLVFALLVVIVVAIFRLPPLHRASSASASVPANRETVVFWHFWGGADRDVVERVVARFNQSQEEYFVRPVAMPGNNLDLKVFLSVAGGDPPDVVNQDDPIIGDWASREAILPLDEIASPDELRELKTWLLPAARELCSYQDRMYGLCNGLDVRALYYNQTWLNEAGYAAPQTIDELDRIALELVEWDQERRPIRVGFLPDARRLWAWGVVFGGDFYDESRGFITPADDRIAAALAWMSHYREQFGASTIAAFRRGDQSLPGAAFPLLPSGEASKGRHAVLMDGQWRVREIRAWQHARQSAGLANVEFGVCPLPPPQDGRAHAGWVNGNFFIVPRNAKNPSGAWAFMKFWSGFGGYENEAATTCAEGGWLPVSELVINEPRFQELVEGEPLLAKFVELSKSPYQVPIPVIPGAAAYKRAIEDAADLALSGDQRTPSELLNSVRQRVQPLVNRGSKRAHVQAGS